jgi:phage regulator Rha-like protein
VSEGKYPDMIELKLTLRFPKLTNSTTMKTSNIYTPQTMTSLEIAELTGKNHFDLLRAIRKMEPAWEKTCGCKFALTSRTIIQPNGGTREVPC